jgi:hypothetical protein
MTANEHQKLPLFCIRDGAHRLVDPSRAAFDSNPQCEKGPGGGFLRPTRPSTAFDPENLLPQIESPFPLRPARNPPQSNFLHWIWRTLTLQQFRKREVETNPARRRRAGYVDNVESQIPLEICLILSNYFSCECSPHPPSYMLPTICLHFRLDEKRSCPRYGCIRNDQHSGVIPRHGIKSGKNLQHPSAFRISSSFTTFTLVCISITFRSDAFYIDRGYRIYLALLPVSQSRSLMVTGSSDESVLVPNIYLL